jgi:hypothetical protein
MNSKRILLVLGLLLLTLGIGSASAEPVSQVEGFAIHLVVSEDGTLTPREVSLGALSLEIPGEEEPMIVDLEGISVKNFSQEGLESFLQGLGLAVEIPRLVIAPEQVEVLMNHGIQSLAIHKKSHGDYQEIGIFANNTKAFEAKMSDAALDLALAEVGLVDMAESLLGSFLMMNEATVSLSFPGAAGDVVFTDMIEAAKGEPLNRIEAGATLAGNEIVSVAGVTLNEINEVLDEMGGLVMWRKLSVAPLEMLDANQIVATAGRNGLRLGDDQGRWMEIAWDQDSRMALYDLVPMSFDLMQSVGYSVPDMYADMIPTVTALVEAWLPSTELKLVVHEATEMVEDLPEIQIGQMLTVELDEEARLSIGGMSLGKTTLDYNAIAPYEWIALRFDGKNREIRSAVAGQSMPIVFLGDHAVAQAGDLLAQNMAIAGLSKIPWDKGDALLERIYIHGVALAAAGQTPDEGALDYKAKQLRIARYFIPSVLIGREDGHIALGDANGAVNLTYYLGPQGKPLADTVKMYTAQVPQGLAQASLTVDPNKLTVDLVSDGHNSSILGIRWDPDLRQSMLSVIDKATGMNMMVDQAAQELAFLGLSKESIPQVETTLLEYLVGAGTFRWGLQVTLIDSMEGVPPTPIEEAISSFGLIRLP